MPRQTTVTHRYCNARHTPLGSALKIDLQRTEGHGTLMVAVSPTVGSGVTLNLTKDEVSSLVLLLSEALGDWP